MSSHTQLATPSERLLSSAAESIFFSGQKLYQAGLEVNMVHWASWVSCTPKHLEAKNSQIRLEKECKEAEHPLSWVGRCLSQGFSAPDCLRSRICLCDDFVSPGSVCSCSSPHPAAKPIGEAQGHFAHQGKASPAAAGPLPIVLIPGERRGTLSRWENLLLINR